MDKDQKLKELEFIQEELLTLQEELVGLTEANDLLEETKAMILITQKNFKLPPPPPGWRLEKKAVKDLLGRCGTSLKTQKSILSLQSDKTEELQQLKTDLTDWCNKKYPTLVKTYESKVTYLDEKKIIFESYIIKLGNCIEFAGKAGIKETIEKNISENAKEALGKALDMLNRKSTNPKLEQLWDNMVDMLENSKYAIVEQELKSNQAGKALVVDGVYTVVLASSTPSFEDSLSDKEHEYYLKIKDKKSEELTNKEQKHLDYFNDFKRVCIEEIKERTIIHETQHLIQAQRGEALQNEAGFFPYTYDVLDEVDAFSAEAMVFGGVFITKYFNLNEITATNVALDPYYGTLPKSKREISMQVQDMVPLTIANTSCNTFEELIQSFDTHFKVKIKGIKPEDTFQQLLESIDEASGSPVWKQVKLQKTW